MPTENASSADNQQEALSNFYYTGFCVGEMSCSLLKLSNKKSKNGGVYYMPDITISNQYKPLLEEMNKIIADNEGVISSIKGGYNLYIRGKRKVKHAFEFFQKYKPIAGDLFFSRLRLLSNALTILENRKTYRRTKREESLLEEIRSKFKNLKTYAIPFYGIPKTNFAKSAIGYFLAGVFDAEGSVGIKKNGSKGQPFFAIAMKDKKVIELFKSFIGFGHIHNRPKEKMIHYEIGSKVEVLKTINMFLRDYPSKLPKMIIRMKNLKRVLNDYTPSSNLLEKI